MDFPGLLASIVLGGLAGWAAAALIKGSGLGVVANVLLGIVGAVVGSVLFNLFGAQGVTGFNVWSFVVALIGSVIVLFVANAVFQNRSLR